MFESYDLIISAYEFYGATSGGSNPFTLSQNGFMMLAVDCEFVDHQRLTKSELDNIFVAVNVEEGDKKSAENQINDDRSLMRHEFVEVRGEKQTPCEDNRPCVNRALRRDDRRVPNTVRTTRVTRADDCHPRQRGGVTTTDRRGARVLHRRSSASRRRSTAI